MEETATAVAATETVKAVKARNKAKLNQRWRARLVTVFADLQDVWNRCEDNPMKIKMIIFFLFVANAITFGQFALSIDAASGYATNIFARVLLLR